MQSLHGMTVNDCHFALQQKACSTFSKGIMALSQTSLLAGTWE